jgi:hypothetical protein
VNSLMPRHDSNNHADDLWANDDELGRLVRWSLATSIGDAEPSPEVWHTILDRVREQRTPRSAQRILRCSSAPLTALVQAAVIGCVLMTLGLGMRRDVVVARNNFAANGAPANETPLVSEPIRDSPPIGGMLVLVDEEEPFRVGGNIREATLPS